jgi:hypothetical protein
MQAVKAQALIEKDGELHLANLPCKKGDRVEVIILIANQPTEEERLAALRRFQARADGLNFRSTGPHLTRDELHERH